MFASAKLSAIFLVFFEVTENIPPPIIECIACRTNSLSRVCTVMELVAIPQSTIFFHKRKPFCRKFSPYENSAFTNSCLEWQSFLYFNIFSVTHRFLVFIVISEYQKQAVVLFLDISKHWLGTLNWRCTWNMHLNQNLISIADACIICRSILFVVSMN